MYCLRIDENTLISSEAIWVGVGGSVDGDDVVVQLVINISMKASRSVLSGEIMIAPNASCWPEGAYANAEMMIL